MDRRGVRGDPILHFKNRDLLAAPRKMNGELNADLTAMYKTREPLYARFADFTVENTGTPEETTDAILGVLQ